MFIVCPACRDEIGDTSVHTVEEAVVLHDCPADDQSYFKALNWVQFEKLIEDL